MGYQTYYQLELDVPDVDVPRPLTEEDIRKLLVDHIGYDPFGDTCKWYDHERDMRTFSAQHAHVLFTLDGEGEESGDVWRKYFRAGKMQEERLPKWEPPPFDAKKLK